MLTAIILMGILVCTPWPHGRADDERPTQAGNESEQAGQAQEAGLVKMAVKYDQTMLVIVSKDGAAGVRFIEPFELGNNSGNGIVGVSYEWRFQSRRRGAEEQTGTGRVYVKLVDNNVRNGSISVTCGPIQLTWAFKEKTLGGVQFNPRDLAVHPVPARHFKKIEARPHIKAVDLRRFLQPKDGQAFHTAGPVLYANCILVVRDTNGIATFEFGKTFERMKDETEKHYGVSYHFTFLSPEGKRKEGDGEVYEKYTNGTYDQGQLDLEAGPLQIKWSRGGDELGWVYYDPVENLIWCVDKTDAETLVGVIGKKS
jgi:hypothetical protein